jgi:hypothetical protein
VIGCGPEASTNIMGELTGQGLCVLSYTYFLQTTRIRVYFMLYDHAVFAHFGVGESKGGGEGGRRGKGGREGGGGKGEGGGGGRRGREEGEGGGGGREGGDLRTKPLPLIDAHGSLATKLKVSLPYIHKLVASLGAGVTGCYSGNGGYRQ